MPSKTNLISWICLGFTVSVALNDCDFHFLRKNQMCNATSSALSLLNFAEKIFEGAKQYIIDNESCNKANLLNCKPMDCAEIQEMDTEAKSGVYKVWLRNRLFDGPVDVYCDMDDDGGSWTVIQRRGPFDSPMDYFFQDWKVYKNGFGDYLKDFWLGNDKIFALTSERANMVKFVLADWDKNKTYATYDEFWISDEDHNYKLHVHGYRGTAGDSFSYANGMYFSTKDRDNDHSNKNCAVLYSGGWWYEKCHKSNLNGLYKKGFHNGTNADGVEWAKFRGFFYSLKETIIKIRPKNFKKEVEANI